MEKEIAFKDILKNLREENLAIFAGAGMSVGAGFVQWGELLSPLAEELGLNIELETDFVSLAQYHVNEHQSRSKVNEILVEEFNQDAKITKNHRILSRLPISTYWTTNYDKLIENSLKANGKNPDVKYTVKQLASTKPNRDATVYKMHGDVEHPGDAIITRDDYERYHKNMEPFLSGLAGDLVTKTFLFIGFSFTDPNLDYILSRVRNVYEDSQRRHYCFIQRIQKEKYDKITDYEYDRKKQELFVKDLQRFSIETIYITDFDEITDFLAELEQEINRKSIFISGSAHEYGNWGRKNSEEFIQDLSRIIIDKGYKIVSGFGLGIGSAVISGALEGILKDNKGLENNSLILRPFPQNIEGKKMWTEWRKDMIKYSGIAIFMFGNKVENGEIIKANGVWEEFEIAKQKGLLIIPIGVTGYIAREIHTMIIENFEEYFPNHHKSVYNLINDLGDNSLTKDEITESVIKLLRKVS